MPHAHTSTVDSDITDFTTSVPPPPYSGPDASNPTVLPQAFTRPRLPEEKRNKHLGDLSDDTYAVKFQTIVRDSKEIVVGRIKVPTPGAHSHAFILRRFDTNAVSLTTMFKVAFPGATEQEETREMDWVRNSFDTRNTNGGRNCDAVRLAGQWVSRHLAVYLAPSYHLTDLIDSLARAVPDPAAQYRKSQRSQAAAAEIARQSQSRPVPSLTNLESTSPMPKRVRRQAPVDGETDQGMDAGEDAGEATAPSTEETINAEIAQAKQLVQELKRAIETREAQEERGADLSNSQRGTKRGQAAGDGVAMSGSSGEDRIIKSNKRVKKDNVLLGGVKTVAYGSLILGIGLGLGA